MRRRLGPQLAAQKLGYTDDLPNGAEHLEPLQQLLQQMFPNGLPSL